MSLIREERVNTILKIIQENEPCTFGLIKKELLKKRQYYNVDEKNNKPLSRELDSLIPDRIIRDEEAKPYPTYSTVQDYSVDTAIMGDVFRRDYVNTFFTRQVEIDGDYMKNDIPLESWDSDNEKLVKSMVIRYGFYMLSMLIKSYEQTITRKHFDRNIWLESTMNLMKSEPMISEAFLGLLGIPHDVFDSKKEAVEGVDYVVDPDGLDDYDPELEGEIEYSDEEMDVSDFDIPRRDLTNKKTKKILKDKLGELREVMDKTYPKMHKSVKLYDAFVERNPKKIKSSDFKKKK